MFWEPMLRFGRGLENTPENLSIFNAEEHVGKKPPQETASHRRKTDTEIDDLDRTIINKLGLNGRMPFAEIANPLWSINRNNCAKV